ncbi:MAG: hypothetical protein KGY54_13455 [Oleiphilaceae bacterium]|nr:hypothetical protein [Oleiphilaceae bacterium]
MDKLFKTLLHLLSPWDTVKNRYSTLLLALFCFAVRADLPPDAHDDLSALSLEALPAEFYAFEPEEFYAEPRDSYWLSFSNWALVQQDIQAGRIQALGDWADRTLSGSTWTLPGNESYLRLGLATRSEVGDTLQLEPEARFKLDLPTVKEKLRLVVESESDELLPIGERQRDRQLTEEQRSDTSATGALRYLTELTDDIDLSNDVGVRLRFPPDAFWRARARKRWALDDDWGLTLDQRVFYFHVDGWGARTWLGFEKSFSEWYVLVASEGNWLHDERNLELSQIVSFYKRLNNRATLNPRIGILGESEPGFRTTNIFADLTYRYRLYDDWLYGEVIPALEFPREEDFKDRASLVLRLEMFFSGEVR